MNYIARENSLVRFAKRICVDSIKIKVRGGSGGHGLPQFGGIGGKGGDVYIKGTNYPVTLKSIQGQNNGIFKAGDGFESRRTRLLGDPGRDLVIKVPVGVVVEGANKEVLGEINTAKDSVIVALGGRGGDKYNDNQGFHGQERFIKLDYKTISDAVFVGFPNAGKSSLLRVVSNATPKVSPQPFTTLRPWLGVVQYSDYRAIKMADLPGLVEGAHKNVGLGLEFLKHIVRTKLLVFVIDINGSDIGDHKIRSPMEILCILNKEIEIYDDTILNKPAILVISKMDSLPDSEDKFKKLVEDIKLFYKDPESFDLIESELKPKKMIKFEDILPISSLEGLNIDEFKQVCREVIDEYAELAKREENKISLYAELMSQQNNRLIKR